jgi:uncharacterized repeat protein (TIGR01451 family)
MRALMRCVAVAAALLTASVSAAGEVELSTLVYRVERGGEMNRVDRALPGDELQYEIEFTNASNLAIDPDTLVITDEIPRGTVYVQDSAAGANTAISFSPERGEIRWALRPRLQPGQSGKLTYRVRVR